MSNVFLDGASTKMMSSQSDKSKTPSKEQSAPQERSNAAHRDSFESNTTLVDTLRQDKGASKQPPRREAKPLVVSSDVQEILQGRIRAGGLQLGGEPLRATGKGKTVVRNETQNSSSSDDKKKQGFFSRFHHH